MTSNSTAISFIVFSGSVRRDGLIEATNDRWFPAFSWNQWRCCRTSDFEHELRDGFAAKFFDSRSIPVGPSNHGECQHSEWCDQPKRGACSQWISRWGNRLVWDPFLEFCRLWKFEALCSYPLFPRYSAGKHEWVLLRFLHGAEWICLPCAVTKFALQWGIMPMSSLCICYVAYWSFVSTKWLSER